MVEIVGDQMIVSLRHAVILEENDWSFLQVQSECISRAEVCFHYHICSLGNVSHDTSHKYYLNISFEGDISHCKPGMAGPKWMQSESWQMFVGKQLSFTMLSTKFFSSWSCSELVCVWQKLQHQSQFAFTLWFKKKKDAVKMNSDRCYRFD